jgi:hypothetical protein
MSGTEHIPTTRVVARGAKAAAEPAMAATITDLYMVGGVRTAARLRRPE